MEEIAWLKYHKLFFFPEDECCAAAFTDMLDASQASPE